jgi:hypothetical protein
MLLCVRCVSDMFFVECILAGNDLFLILGQVASECVEESQPFSPSVSDEEVNDAEARESLHFRDQKPRWFSDRP